MPDANIGTLPVTVGKDEAYFRMRHCFIDTRGELTVAASSTWGFNIRVYTATHDISKGALGTMIYRKVEVKDNAWICSDVVLFDCTIGEHAIVSIGSVVSGLDVEPYTMVAGNPAVAVARLVDNKWIRL